MEIGRDEGAVDQLKRFQAETRLKVVAGLLRAQDLGWPLVAAVEGCSDRAEARAVLMTHPFGFDALEAEHVLDRPLGQRTRLGVESLAEEREDLTAFLGRE